MKLQIQLGPAKTKELRIKLYLTITVGWGLETVGRLCVQFQAETVVGL